MVNLKNPNGVYKWAKSQDENGTRPSYNALIRMLQHGATVETLFGIAYKNKQDPIQSSIKITDDDIARAFIRAGEMLKNQEGEK